MDEIDIWRAAHLLIQQYGEGAESEAARLGNLAIERGDARGRGVWCDVLKAITSLANTKTAEPLN